MNDQDLEIIKGLREVGLAAAKNAMEVMGYVLTVKDGWLVKEHKDGRSEQIEKLEG